MEEEWSMSNDRHEINWQSSSRCSSGACVKVARGERRTYVKDENGTVVEFSTAAWQKFLDDVVKER
jgi:hypothetical protein